MVKTSDIFLQEDLDKLFHNKFVVVIGDSNQRSIYKDLVMLLQKNAYISDRQLRAKGEFHYENDELIEGGRSAKMVNGVNYREVRQYQTDTHLVRFYFVTKCYSTYMESILSDFNDDVKPDVVIMNSCLWDISRYGKNGVEEYKSNLKKVFARFRETLPEETLVIWNSTLPISKTARGGFLVPGIEFMNNTLRLDILEANFYAKQIVVSFGYDLLDLHFHLRDQLHRRADDGIHWDKTAHRRISNLILTHIADAWREKKPGRATRAFRVSTEDILEHSSDTQRFDEDVNINDIPLVNNQPIVQKWERHTFGSPPVNGYMNTGMNMSFNTVASFNNPANERFPQYIDVPLYRNVNMNVINQPTHSNAFCSFTRPTVPNNTSFTVLNKMQQLIANQTMFLQNQRMNSNLQPHIMQQPSTVFNWQPYAQQQLQTINRNPGRRHAVRENPYVNRQWFRY